MHPATTFVIDRSPAQERKSKRGTILICALQGITVLLVATSASLSLAHSSYPWMVWLQFTGMTLMLMGIAMQLSEHLTMANMRNLRLVMTPQGVTYTSSAGTFSAPWTAVKKTKFRGHPGGIGSTAPHVVVHVPGWNGPVSGFPLFNRLLLHLTDTGVDSNQIATAVHHLSGGTRQTVVF
ncbi:hypothetical protein FHX42_003209 [Saccharopolyspora lacisalsi]|uniref:Uncharacterized protein n=1 Tax=Halosaccharopolyspora lacisalsi TaxID=1000566 RepID=A0A839DXS1_9PSEU|nr:hypothetical protein [Halosaccharopolyspora lacisalsi]MBA8825843.1 hypothetical protein [Halosaccharopolyspora lacisalsi]